MKLPNPSPCLNPALRWRRLPQVAAPSQVRDWLRDAGSLTRRLQQLGRFSVRPTHQQIEPPRPEEMRLLRLRFRQRSLIREVILSVNGEPVVYARSVLPLHSLRGANRVLGHMARRSLGAELFKRPRAERRQIWAARLPGAIVPGGEAAWGRQSLFLKRGHPLLVAEVFLPRLWRCCAGNATPQPGTARHAETT